MPRYTLFVLLVCAALFAGCGSAEPTQSENSRLNAQIENAEGIAPAELAERAGMEVGQADEASSAELPPSYVEYKADCKLLWREGEESEGKNAIFYIDDERRGRGSPGSLDPQAVPQVQVYKCAKLIEGAVLKRIIVDTENAR